jgi:hypothetical protein
MHAIHFFANQLNDVVRHEQVMVCPFVSLSRLHNPLRLLLP